MICVEVEAALAVDGVGAVGIGVGSGAVGTLGPAFVDGISGTRAVSLKVLGIRQRHGGAGGGEGAFKAPLRVADAAAERTYIEIICSVRRQAGDGDSVVTGDEGDEGCHRVGIDRGVVHSHLIVGSVAGPSDGGRGVGDSNRCGIGGTQAGGNLGADVEGHVRTVVGADS